MYLELDGKGPRHAQLTRALKAAILAGALGAGARLPATRTLARELELSRNTVLTAYEQLRAEGFVEGRVGSGSYVSTLSLPAAPVPAASAQEATPQTRFARRARALHDPSNLPGRTYPGARFSLQYGVPITNPALTTAWSRELARAAVYTRPGYPMTQGLPELRAAVCDYLARRRGVQARPEDVLIVNGTQQALALAGRVLLDEGDEVVLEEPHYFGSRRGLQIHGAEVIAVRTDAEGLVCSELPTRAPRLICVTPSHQFPGGSVLSLPRRLALLRYAAEKRCWILEDDYDGEFRYDAHPLAALRSLDDADRVIYIGTFSKALFPALRMGYMVLPASLRRDFINAKWVSDFGSSAIEQAALAGFINDGGFERHLRRAAKSLRARRAVLLEGLRRYAGDRVDVVDSRAGMHLVAWLRGRTRAQGDALIAHALSRGLGLYAIAPHYLHPPDQAGLLLGYGGLSVAEIEEAVRLFGRCLDEMDSRGWDS